MRAEITADFMSDPNYIIITCHICNEAEKVPTTGTAVNGLFKGQQPQRSPSDIDKEIRKIRLAHEKAHKE